MYCRRQKFLTPLVALLLCCGSWAIDRANAADLAAARAEIDREFLARLDKLAEKCDELNLAAQAKITRGWFIKRDPRRQYLFAPAAADPVVISPTAEKNVQYWYKNFTKARQAQAERLYELSKQRLEEGYLADAYQLLYEVLREDPDHLPARRILDYRKVRNRWQQSSTQPKAKRSTIPLPRLGWKGNRWRVESSHFLISTNHSAKVGLEAADELEKLYDVWQQVFAGYWSSESSLKRRFEGLSARGPEKKKHRVVLFRDRREYIAFLKPNNPRIELTKGIYTDGDGTTYIYAGDPQAKATWYHEATHQLFHETGRVAPKVGGRQNFWIIEGVALYMESLATHRGYYTVGGADANRLQFARFRFTNDEFYRPLEKLVQLNQDSLQRDEEIRPLYSQAAGLTHFLMDHDRGRYRQALVKYLRSVYQGRDNRQSLASLTETKFAELDKQYGNSLAVSDADLRHLNPADYVRNLSLGQCAVTDAGLAKVTDCRQLEWLDLSYTKTTDAGIKHLAGLTNLDQLFLTGTQISDEGLVHLYKLKRLTSLDLQQTRVTAEGVSRLKRALPALKDVEH